MRIYFDLPRDGSLELQARLAYAFRLFCAVYGHLPIVDAGRAGNRDVTIRYRSAARNTAIADARTVWLSRGYRARDPRQPERGQTPDWLGEIFEWVSCADEYSVTDCDRIGRPRFEATYAGRHGIDMRVPYAALAMRALQMEICRVTPRAPESPCPPGGLDGHAVIPTHDVDYFPVSRKHAVSRLSRNAVISCMLQYRPGLGLRQAQEAVRIALGSRHDPLDCIVNLADQEQRLGFSASYYFLVRDAHRRDARYSIENRGVTETMRWLSARQMEVGLHGSYTSLDDPHGLEYEAGAMAAQGFQPVGSRQHWLRYTHDRLLPAVERAGLQYDTSIGWSTRIGFRAGACFAYPPYDFVREAPAAFLEFPLIAMDQALALPRGEEGHAFYEVSQMIAASRRLGWGGISLLWHPAAFGPGWLPPEIGEIFWRLAHDRLRWNDAWMKGSSFLEIARSRYVEAGLLSSEAPSLVPQESPLLQASGQRSRAAASSVRFA